MRPIPEVPSRDAMGCYPLFSCDDWASLGGDLDGLAGELVSLALVTDPFGGYDAGDLRRWFPDRVLAFKEHFVADLDVPLEQLVSRHHRYYARRASEAVDVERCAAPRDQAADWVALYSSLAERLELTGVKAMSPHALTQQLDVPGAALLRASSADETVALHLWYVGDGVAHSHLAATSERGYELMAPYALHRFALETFAGEARWVNFGAGAGLRATEADGLSRFKRGWASETRTSYFCGRIFDREAYAEAMARSGHGASSYFPAYRHGELA